MTLDNDMIRLQFTSGEWFDVFLSVNPECGIAWPPPERLEFMCGSFKRVSMSTLTDEQARTMTNVARGAVYQQEMEAAANELPI